MENKQQGLSNDELRIALKKYRKGIFEDTLKVCKENNWRKVNSAKFDDGQWLKDTQLKMFRPTIQVLNQDCVEVARVFSHYDGKTCMLNMANAKHRGGGVVNGALAQEEELCRRSNLWYGLRKSYYPMSDTEFIYSKNVKFFKNKQYEIIPTFKCDVITVAAPCLIGFKKGRLPKGYSQTVNNKIKQILEYPAHHGIKHLVLSAFGCGAFRNNPVFISRVFKHYINTLNLPYQNIYFAILDDGNAQANGISNFQTFKNTFKV